MTAPAVATPPPTAMGNFGDFFGSELSKINTPPAKEEPTEEEEKPEVTKPDAPPNKPDKPVVEEEQPAAELQLPEVPDAPPDPNPTAKQIKTWADLKAELKSKEEALKKATSDKDAEITALKEELKQRGDLANTSESTAKQNEEFATVIDTLKAENEKLKADLKVADYTRSEAYIKEYAEPVGKIKAAVESIAQANELDARALWLAVTEPDTKRRVTELETLAESLGKAATFEVFELAKEFARKEEVKSNLSEQAKAEWDKRQNAEAADRTKFKDTDQREHATHVRDQWGKLQEAFPFVREYEGSALWNQAVRKAQAESATTDLDTLETPQRAEIVAKANVLPFVAAALKGKTKSEADLKVKVTELESQIAALTNSSPRITGGQEPPEAVDETAGKTLSETIDLKYKK